MSNLQRHILNLNCSYWEASPIASVTPTPTTTPTHTQLHGHPQLYTSLWPPAFKLKWWSTRPLHWLSGSKHRHGEASSMLMHRRSTGFVNFDMTPTHTRVRDYPPPNTRLWALTFKWETTIDYQFVCWVEVNIPMQNSLQIRHWQHNP